METKKDHWFSKSKDDSADEHYNNEPPARNDRKSKFSSLLNQIEHEFNQLYAENYKLRKKLNKIKNNCDASAADQNNGNNESLTHKSSFKSKGGLSSSQISQKLKTTYKSGTSKLVSSFKPNNNVVSKLVQTYVGHVDGILEIDSSPVDFDIIATASADQTAKLWNAESGDCLATYGGHQGSVNSVKLHPTKRIAITASGDKSLHLWSYEHLENSQPESSPTHSPPGCQLRDTLMVTKVHSGPVSSCSWLPNGNQFVTASWDRTACIVDATANKTFHTLTGHDLPLTFVSAHDSEKLIVTSSQDATFRVCDLRVPSIHTVTVGQGHSRSVTSAVFANNEKIITSSEDRTVKVWELRSMRAPTCVMTFDSGVNRISTHRNMVALPFDNRNVRVYTLDGIRVSRLPRNERLSHARVVTSTCFVNSRDASSPVSLLTCGWDKVALNWNVLP